MNRWVSTITLVLVVVAGFGVLSLATDQGRAFTAESARRLDVLANPVALTNGPLVDETGRVTSIARLPDVLVVNFVFTTCPTVCLSLGSDFRDLQVALKQNGWHERVELLSVSFDPERDDRAALQAYLRRFSADSDYWSAATFENPSDLAHTLKSLGVVVIEEPNLGFVHNAAIYLVKKGRVVGIYDIGQTSQIITALSKQIIG